MRYFAELAGVLHFRRAAEVLNISQPALSAQVAEMETHLGVRLFERSHAGVRLTEDGRVVRDHVRRVLTTVQDLEDAMSDRRGLLQRELSLGIIPTLAPYLLPRFLPVLREQHPSAAVVVHEALTEPLIERLRAGALDVILFALPFPEAGLETEALFDDRFFLATPSAGPGFARPLRADDLAPEHLLLLDEGHCLRDQTLAMCGAQESRSSPFGAASLSTLVQLVGQGMGHTLIPEIALPVEGRSTGVRIVPFVEPAPHRTVALGWRRNSYREADFRTLGQIIRATCAPS